MAATPYTAFTLADVRTAAWLVENGHTNKLEKLVLSSDLDNSSVSAELDVIKRLADISVATDVAILGQLACNNLSIHSNPSESINR